MRNWLETGTKSRSVEKRVNVKSLGKRPIADCKTVYPGSIPGVASKKSSYFNAVYQHVPERDENAINELTENSEPRGIPKSIPHRGPLSRSVRVDPRAAKAVGRMTSARLNFTSSTGTTRTSLLSTRSANQGAF